MKRKWISVLLLLALTLALLPTAALADGEDWKEINQNNIASLVDAQYYLTNSGNYKLTEDITLADTLSIGPVSKGAEITLDLNGFKLTGTDKYDYALWINQNTTLTIVDNSSTGGGSVVSLNGTAVKVYTNAVFILKSGTISGGVVVGVGSFSNDDTTAFTMKGGSITGGLTADGKTTINLNDGTVDGIWLGSNSTLYANGGTVTGPSKIYGNVVGNDTDFQVAGQGTLNEPWELKTADQLKAFRDLVNRATNSNYTPYGLSAKLTADIDLDGEAWMPIAPSILTVEEYKVGYHGTFDGNGHTISGLNVTGNFKYAGLFGVVTGGTIKNLTVSGSVVSSSTENPNAAGGIAGKATDSTIEACANLCSVSADQYVGGIAGMIHNTTVRDCYNIGTISGTSNAGGIVGMTPSQRSNAIVNCYNVGNVSASSYAGGILGNAGPVDVSNCYYLKGTAKKAIGNVNLEDIEVHAPKTAEEFADGTVRDLLYAGRDYDQQPWDSKCRFVPKADKYLPVFKYQNSYEPAPESSGSSGSRFSYSTISATAGENGKISPSGDLSVRDDHSQTFVFTPDKGYRVKDVLIDGKSVGALRSYTFATVRKNRTVEVVFEKIPAFTDVPAGSYYEDAVNWAMDNWITEGTSDTRFSPDAPCTRAQAVTLLWRAAGCPAPSSYTMPFTDVKSGSYYETAVLWALENGITKGVSETLFAPEAVCTRAQIVSFLYRMVQAEGGGFTGAWMFRLPFTDTPEWAYEAIAWCYQKGITEGTGEAAFSPDAPCTRAQIVTFLYRCRK